MKFKSMHPNGYCSGTTKAGARCQRLEVYENGRCIDHGPKGMLYRLKARQLRALKKSKRLNKWDKFIASKCAEDPKLKEMLEKLRNGSKEKGMRGQRTEEQAGASLPE